MKSINFQKKKNFFSSVYFKLYRIHSIVTKPCKAYFCHRGEGMNKDEVLNKYKKENTFGDERKEVLN